MYLGAHLSIAGGVDKSFDRAIELDCTAFQIFTKSNRQWRANPLKPDEVERFHAQQEATGISPVVCHASYLLNLGSPDEALWHKSIEALVEELARCETLNIPTLVLHPGSHVKSGVTAGIARVAQGLEIVHQRLADYRVRVALEITAGQGTALGSSFEEIMAIIESTPSGDRLDVCFDTCHALAAGYEFRTPERYEEMIAAFDRIIGLSRLAAVHMNDSQKDLGSHVDRHEHIGEGRIGLEPFGFFLNDPRLQQIPFLLETPVKNDPADNQRNLEALRSLLP